MAEDWQLAHYSDTHLGREAFHEVVSASGFNQRGIDIVKAWHAVGDHIREGGADVPLALHAGDVCDTSAPKMRYLVAAKRELERITCPVEPGSPYVRQQVVIAGNHDVSRNPTDPCFLALFRGKSGLHIVTSHYEVVDFEDEVAAGTADPRLKDVRVHAIPHDELKSLDWDQVNPIPGKQNILLTHGVAEGSKLFIQARGREYPVPSEVLNKDWSYVALGHWHKRGPVFLSADTKATESRMWYAGSPENVNFSDARDDHGKGYLRVRLGEGRELPEVEPVTLPIRAMFTLPAVDAEDLSPEEIAQQLVERVREADEDGRLYGSVVRQRVVNANPDLWSLVDRKPARDAARPAMAYEVLPMYHEAADVDQRCCGPQEDLQVDDDQGPDYVADLRRIAEDVVAQRLRPKAIETATDLLNKHLQEPIGDDVTADAGKQKSA